MHHKQKNVNKSYIHSKKAATGRFFYVGLYQIFLSIMVTIKIILLDILNVLECARI